jgi:uncharacterized protein YjgD (DUF1641 family)
MEDKIMAEPISFEPVFRNRQHELYPRVQSAPGEHAEAMLDVYAILELARQKGILEIIKDALGSLEGIMEVITETAEKDEVVRTVRNLTILIKMLGSIEPEALEQVMKSISNATVSATSKKPPGFLQLLSQLSSGDSRRALEPIAAGLQAAGSSIPKIKKKERAHTSRHGA